VTVNLPKPGTLTSSPLARCLAINSKSFSIASLASSVSASGPAFVGGDVLSGSCLGATCETRGDGWSRPAVPARTGCASTVRRGCLCPGAAAHSGAGNVEIVTASRWRRARSVALRWCRSALAAICVPANAGLDHVGATGGRDHVGDVRAIRAIQMSRRRWHGACASTKAGLTRSEATVIGSPTGVAGRESAWPFGGGEAICTAVASQRYHCRIESDRHGAHCDRRPRGFDGAAAARADRQLRGADRSTAVVSQWWAVAVVSVARLRCSA
jgi:hypothetical protein